MKLRRKTETIRSHGRKALAPFFTAGYPDPITFLKLVEAAEEAACPVMEIGVPFSDPIADGPVIQASSLHALKNGVNLTQSLDLAKQALQITNAAMVLMGYFNPILKMGVERFADQAAQAGLSGVIVPDIPFEESFPLREILKERGIVFVDLAARTTGIKRLQEISKKSDGFFYLVSITGVTGAKASFGKSLNHFVEEVRTCTDIPLYVGFGISGLHQAVEASAEADGVIIGSAIVKIIRNAKSEKAAVSEVRYFLEKINRAMHQ